ncbi:hypothetical protein ONV78_24145 [Hahella sp. CR1]|uniref:hypothetical protein n=1 Tax=Hahella sp. CR1 TaxID=2992807 RepID=UPI0024419A06|nr:hypothetical protein [Hahella sp. CR1]MDG9670852.1 hypothetical protein [Hahella sp. CR1]
MGELKELEEIVDLYLSGKSNGLDLLTLIAVDHDKEFASLGDISFTPSNTIFDSGFLSFCTVKNPSSSESLKLHLSPEIALFLEDLRKYWGEYRRVPTSPGGRPFNYAFPKVLKPSYQYSGYIHAQLSAPVDTPDSKVVVIMIRRDPISNSVIIA